MQHAVWYELLPYADLLTKPVLDALVERELGVYIAVTPDRIDGIAEAVHTCAARGLRVGVWPMIERENGRWPSAHNLTRFRAFVKAVRAQLHETPNEIVIDLEPPIDALPGLMALDRDVITAHLRRGLPVAAERAFAELVQGFHDDDMETLAAVFPLVLSDGDAKGWQSFFGTPVDAVGATRVSAMLYTSIMEGFFRGWLERRDTLSLLGHSARIAHRRFGRRTSISVGAIDVGALGDEPTYRSVDELREDVAVTKAAGVEHIVLFSLCGAIRRGPIESWLDALVETEATAVPELTPRAAIAMASVWSAARAMRAAAWCVSKSNR